MRHLKLLFGLLVLLLLTVGCATHAKIDVPATTKVNSANWQGKSFNVDIYYSQPEPGVFSAGNQQELKPLKEAKLSVGAVQVLSNLPQTVMAQLPMNAVYTEESNADYFLHIELIAHNKRGPTFADYEFGKNLAKSFLTLGLGADEYNIIADFDVKYTLTDQGGQSYEKAFAVKESIDHERSSVEFKNNTYDYAAELLKKHIMLTSSAFLNEAKTSI
jgi:hypothetical protein